MTAPTIWEVVPGSEAGAGSGYQPPLNGATTADGSGNATVTLAANPQRDILIAYICASALGSTAPNPQVIVYDAVVALSGYIDSGGLIKPGPATVGWYDPPRIIPAGHSIICVFSGLNSGDPVDVRVEYFAAS